MNFLFRTAQSVRRLGYGLRWALSDVSVDNVDLQIIQEYSCLWLKDTWPKSLQRVTDTDRIAKRGQTRKIWMTGILTPAVRLHHFRLQFWRPTATTGSLRYITSPNAKFLFSVLYQKNYINQTCTQFLVNIMPKCFTWDVYTVYRPANWYGSSLALMGLWQLFQMRIYSVAEEETLVSEKRLLAS
jgi:hypothetical protein